MELSPGENLIELQVSLPNALSGKVTVAVSSAGLVLEQESVRVSASYLDRLVIIGAVILLMIVMLVFIIRKVRTSEVEASSPARHHGAAPADDERGEA
jgi:type VI protein secretion system component VasK